MLIIYIISFEFLFFNVIFALSSQELELVNAKYVSYKDLDLSALGLTCPGIKKTSDSIIQCFYSIHKSLVPIEYVLAFPTTYNIEILVNPCLVNNSISCSYLSEPDFIIADEDLLLAWKTNNYIIACSNEFLYYQLCGTYLEIHRPLDPIIFQELEIDRNNLDDFTISYISTKGLCAGKYEIWFVFRSQSGFILQYIKPFYIGFPSCKT